MTRRRLLGAFATAAFAARTGRSVRADMTVDAFTSAPGGSGTAGPLAEPAGPAAWRARFPLLDREVGGRPLVYLDTAATAQRPDVVIDAVAGYYRRDNANPGRTLHAVARRAYERYEGARTAVARFVNAVDPSEIVWTRGTTEAINLVASSWGSANLKAGDEIVLTIAEHYSNLLPWQIAARRAGAVIRTVDITPDGRLRLDHLDSLLSGRTRLVAVSHVSNVLGIINPVRAIADRAHPAGARVLVDAAQSVPHIPVDVQALDCDFLAFSSHKMLGPMGVGVLWARRELLEAMPPYQAGSNMAHDVEGEQAVLEHAAWKFGAGTPNVSGPIGLQAAVEFLEGIGLQKLWAYEQSLTRHALGRLAEVPGLRLLGEVPVEERIAVFTFGVEGRAVPDLVRSLDAEGIAIRGGDMAALPLLKRLGLSAAARASCYLYNTTDDIDRLVETLRKGS